MREAFWDLVIFGALALALGVRKDIVKLREIDRKYKKSLRELRALERRAQFKVLDGGRSWRE